MQEIQGSEAKTHVPQILERWSAATPSSSLAFAVPDTM